MPSVRAFHSTRQHIHHRDETCGSGRAIAPEDMRFGTGGKDLCPECIELVRAKGGESLFDFALTESPKPSAAT